MYKKIILLGMLLFFLGGCVRATFNPLAADFHAKKSASIAVISGLEKGGNAVLAHYVTEALKEKSNYRVMSQAAIAKAVKGYPYNIQGPYSSAYFNIEKDYTRTDVEKIRRLQKKLGVDYLFVMWAPISVTMNNVNNVVHVITQMFEFPGAHEVGRGLFYTAARKVTWSFSGRVKDSEIDQGMQKASLKVASELAARTGMGK
jgi:hypothetical protein